MTHRTNKQPWPLLESFTFCLQNEDKKMLKCCAIASVLVLAAAHTPTRPVFSETFYASGEVELHATEETRIGKFKMACDQTKMMGVEENTFVSSGRSEVEEVLQRYDQKKTYYIRGMGEDAHCISMDSNGLLSPFWGWLEYATYEGGTTVDVWGVTIADTRLEVGVDKETPNSPVFFNRLSPEDFVYFRFMSFNGTTPSSTYFVVPSVCNE